jgi:hypothetical protein
MAEQVKQSNTSIRTKNIARIRNVAYIMSIMFKELSFNTTNNLVTNKTLIDNEIERKQKAYDYLKKYGSLTLNDAIKELQETFNTEL